MFMHTHIHIYVCIYMYSISFVSLKNPNTSVNSTKNDDFHSNTF